MQKYINFTFILGVLFALFINSIDAKKTNKFSKQSKKEILNDGYYAIFVNTTTSDCLNKREVQEEIVNSLVDEIHTLILGNVKTYQNPNVVEEMIHTEKLRKRDNEEAEFEVVYHLSSLDNRSVIGAFLSNDLIDYVQENQLVYAITPNRSFKYTRSSNTNNIDYSKLYANARHNADFHLSLISQDNLTGKDLSKDYDTTYYPLGNAGKDVDIFIFDTAFSFDDSEYKNNNKRITQCVANLSYGRVEERRSEKFCFSASPKNHGYIVTDIAAGAVHGVASNANVYGFVVEEGNPTIFSIFKGFELLSLRTTGKAVVNLSIGDYHSNIGKHEDLDYLHDLIKKLNDRGIIVVAAAGNDGDVVKRHETMETFYPCAFDEVICVGSTETPYLSYYDENENKEIYVNPYVKAGFSNYGDGVNIYAPGYVKYRFYTEYYGVEESSTYNTSFSSPIVVGVIASIMSENPNQKYNAESMKKELYRRSYKGVIIGEDNEESNYFINNGAIQY